MSCRSLGVWRVYFCLFFCWAAEKRVKQLIGKLEFKWEEMVEGHFQERDV